MELALFAAPIASLVGFGAARRWRSTLLMVMLLLVFEGALRKWFFPGLQGPIYFIKDFLLLAAIFGFYVLLPPRRRASAHEPLLHSLKFLLALSLVYFSLEIANPNSPSPLLGIIGLKSYLFYAPLLFIVPYAFTTIADMDRKLRVYMFLAVPVMLLGLVQFGLPTDHVLNTYVKHNADIDIDIANFGRLGTQVRTTATFSYIAGFAVFITTMFHLSVAYVLTRDRDWRKNIVPLVLLAASCAAMLTTGSRGVVLATIGMLPVVLFLCMRANLVSGTLVIRLTIISAIVVAVTMFIAGDAFDALSTRAHSSSDSVADRLLTPITQAIEAFERVPFFGFGVGTTHNAASKIMGTEGSWWLRGVILEDEAARVMTEVGVVGFVLVYAVRFTLLGWAITMVTRLRTPRFKALSACIAGFLITQIPSTVINNPTANLYLWFAAGLLFAMYRLDCERAWTPVVDKRVSLPRKGLTTAIAN